MSYAEFPVEGQEKIIKGQDVGKQIVLVRGPRSGQRRVNLVGSWLVINLRLHGMTCFNRKLTLEQMVRW